MRRHFAAAVASGVALIANRLQNGVAPIAGCADLQRAVRQMALRAARPAPAWRILSVLVAA